MSRGSRMSQGGLNMDQDSQQALLKRLQQVEDLEAIKRLKAKYFWALDNKLWDMWGSVFTEDVEADFSDDFSRLAGRPVNGLIKGRENLVRIISYAMPQAFISVHQGHMPQIDITGPDTAKGVWQLHDFLDDGERQQTGFGHYFEEYVRQDGQWLIKRYAEKRLFVEWTTKELGPPKRLRELFEKVPA